MTDSSHLFTPFKLNRIALANRFVMPAMQRGQCIDGRPTDELAAYYRRRVEGGVSLIIGESCAVDHPSATRQASAARLTAATLGGWQRCVEEVHAAGGHMLIQLWHEGALRNATDGGTISPSGLVGPGRANGRAATLAEIGALRAAFIEAARSAQSVGADGVEVHAAHGYLLDQFLWPETNQRHDGYGGADMADRVRLPAEIVAGIRAACGPHFVISLRFSQWKEVDYGARVARDPAELATFTSALKAAGLDVFHASTRRFWQAEWPGDPRGLAGWVRSTAGLPVIAVGSVGLDTDVMTTFIEGKEPKPCVAEAVAELERRMASGEFDLVAVGRSLIGDPDWVQKLRERQYDSIRPFRSADLGTLEWDTSIVTAAHGATA